MYNTLDDGAMMMIFLIWTLKTWVLVFCFSQGTDETQSRNLYLGKEEKHYPEQETNSSPMT